MICFKILVLCAFVAVAKSQIVDFQSHYTNFNTSVLHPDNFLNAHRRQQLANIWIYNHQIETFKTLYTERIKTISLQKKLLIDGLIQLYLRLYPYEILSGFNKDCVDKYKELIPPVSAAEYNFDNCITAANNLLNSLIVNPSATNRTLQTYYLNNFEKSIQTCQKNYPNSELNYTLCIQNAISAANVYTINNQKTFASQMDSSENSAVVYVKRAVDCVSGVQNSTISARTLGDTLIERCIQGLDNCNQCTGYYCDNVYYIPSSSIDYRNQTMKNVFYGSDTNMKCLMLDIYKVDK